MSTNNNISVTMYTTILVDNQPIRSGVTASGSVELLVGEGMAGVQHLIMNPRSAQVMAEELLAAVRKATAGAVA